MNYLSVNYLVGMNYILVSYPHDWKVLAFGQLTTWLGCSLYCQLSHGWDVLAICQLTSWQICTNYLSFSVQFIYLLNSWLGYTVIVSINNYQLMGYIFCQLTSLQGCWDYLSVNECSWQWIHALNLLTTERYLSVYLLAGIHKLIFC